MVKKDLKGIDCNVGRKIREARETRGISQSKLAEELELSFQQIQKYEKGKNRVSASRLYQIAKILNQTVSYFYEEPNHHWPENRGRDFHKWLNLYEKTSPSLRNVLYKTLSKEIS
ncbi:MAG: hypothetical protein NPINA01_32240 [Nitrospinaceae bacterium]|jgi:transcriptional regulator with XRE-family HTH domain|nr:MAG: hypothetical protein NPINA01_32240 [Nitrospinaceae bacterium]